MFILKGQRTMGLFWLFVFCFFAFSAKAQTYYYFVNDIATKSGDTVFYKTLLTLQPNGKAIARIQYNSGVDNKLFLYQISLSDSTIGQENSNQRYLIPNTEPVPLLDEDSATFLTLRFIFNKKLDSPEYYYEPSAVEVQLKDDNWELVKSSLIQQKTYLELRQDEPFVNSFYFQTDEFYEYIFEDKLRATVLPRSEKLYLIVLANTNDKTIGESAAVDLKNVSAMFTKLAQDLGITTVIPFYISGKNFSKLALEKALGSIEQSRLSSNDIVIFYYSGHGFRLTGDKSAYPNISFRTPKNRTDGVLGDYMPLEDVYKRLTALNPKVCLVFGDCCNANINQNTVFGPDLLRSKKGGGTLGNFNTELGKKLFFPALPLYLIVGSVQEDHLSIGNTEIGGFFTHFFSAELEQNLWGYYSNVINSSILPTNSLWLKILVAARTNTFWQSKSVQCGATQNDRCIQRAVIGFKPSF